jgi:hypothetical protein
MIPQIAPIGQRTRISPDSAWPLRGADGKTFAERKESEASKPRAEWYGRR